MNSLILSTFLADTITPPNIDIDKVTSGVTDIAGAISDYGFAVVVIAVFFVVFLILIIIMLYSNTKMMNMLMKSNQSSNITEQELLSKLLDKSIGTKEGDNVSNTIVDILSKRLDEAVAKLQQNNNTQNQQQTATPDADDYHKDLIGAYVDLNLTYKSISRVTMTKLCCDRVAIYVFHNGNSSMYGLPFFKLSCVHEWTSHGSNTLRGKSHTDIPLHVFGDVIDDLYRNGVYKAQNIQEKMKEEDSSIGEFVSYSNTKSIYLIAVKSDDNVITGFISAEFNHEDCFETDDHRDTEIRAILDEMVMKISPILSTQYTYKPKH